MNTATARYPHLHQPPGGYVFVVTWGRSGSTLLQAVLNAIPGYCIRGENSGVIADLSQAWATIERSEPMRGLRWHHEEEGRISPPEHPWYGAEDTVPDEFGLGLADVFVRDILKLPPNTRVAGFKEIRYHETRPHPMDQIRFMAWFFPNARFIINTRSHEATMKSGWWATMSPERVKVHLAGAEALFARIEDEFPTRSLRLHYEDYAGNPEAMRPMFEFLGEPFDKGQIARVMENRLIHTGME